MLTILTALLPLGLKIIGLFMEKKKDDIELQRSWIAFLEKAYASKSFNNSTSLKQSYDAQKARMDALEKESNKDASPNP